MRKSQNFGRLQQVFFKRADQSIESSYTVNYRQITVNQVTYNTEMIDTVVDSVAGTFGYGYDSIDRMVSETGPAGSVVVAYDDLDRRKQLQVSGQGLVTYGYNLTNAIETITQNSQSATFQYDELGRMKQRLLPNGVSTEWGFDTAGFLHTVISKLNGVAFDSHTLMPDPVGNITQETITTPSGTQQNSFGYDDLYRLQTASVGGVASSWAYDNTGNRTSQTVGGVVTSYTPDDANRLIAVNGVTVTNDANGNVTGDGTKTYSWDVWGRLVGMTGPGLAASFVYDCLGRRYQKTINGTTTTFLNDGADVVTDIIGGVAKQTLHGPLIDEPLARDGLFFTPNHLGSTTTLTDISGVVQQSYSYSPFGETSGSGTAANPFQFTGRENDGTGLYYNRRRYYVPAWGRFLSEDPLGFAGGLNRYAYAGNDPINWTDPKGLGPELALGPEDPYNQAGGAGGAAAEFEPPIGPGAEPIPPVSNLPVPYEPPGALVPYQRPGPITPYYPPNDGFEGPSIPTTLEPGKLTIRYGHVGGKYLADPGTPWYQLSLPYRNPCYGGQAPPTGYVVVRGIEGVRMGPAAPWFGQPGGGTQYYLGEDRSVGDLIRDGFLALVEGFTHTWGL